MARQTERVELESPRFGEFARRHAGVGSEEVREALDLQQQKGGRLGALLVEGGSLTDEQVTELLRLQARWVAESRSNDSAGVRFPLSTPISLCMPCYNEEEVIREVLSGALAVLPEFLEEFELVIVDDGSADATAEVVSRFAERDPRVRLVRHEQNRGYGAAVATALRAADGDYVFFTDGDGQFNLLDLPQLLVEMPKSDVVIGYRYNRADHQLRSFNAKGWNWIIRSTLGVRVRDLDCAFKIFPRRVIDRLMLDSEGACISAEILAQCVHGGVSIREVPVNHFPRSVGEATGANLRVIAKAFRELPVLWKYRSMKPWNWEETPADARTNGHGDPEWQQAAPSDADREAAAPVGAR